MKLQIRLTLVALGMVLLFVATFSLVWSLNGGQQVMRPPPRGELCRKVARQASQIYREGGWEALQSALRFSLFPNRASTLYDLKGVEKAHWGSRLSADSSILDEALRRGALEQFTWTGMEIWARVDGSDGPVAVLRIVMFPRNHEDQRWHYAYLMITSGIAAALVSLTGGMLASRAIARPISQLVEATRALSRSDFHHRIAPQGWDEVRDLADSFNLMADHLEKTVTSLTEAKEKAEGSEASRRQFLADVSHNLRTPLAAVLGWTEALQDGLTPGEEHIHLRNIREETMYVARNVQRLTDWSRWEGQAPKLRLEPFPVSEPLMECLQSLEDAAQAKNMTMELIGLEEEPFVRADRIRLRELFQLLLENAIHHNEPDQKLKVEFALEDQRLRVTVSDNGPGLPEELREDLECRVGGGLGLAIAVRLAAAHGGKLEALPGPGTSLSFTLEWISFD